MSKRKKGGHFPIRVLYTTHASNLTGASRSLLDMLSGLPKEKVEPTVLLRKHGPIEEKLKELGVEYNVLPHIPWVNSRRGRFPDSIKRLIHAVAQPRIDRFVRDGNFDLIHSNSLLCGAGMIAAKKAAIPYISHMRDMVEEDHDMYHINDKQLRGVVYDAKRVICISEMVARKYNDWCRKGACVVINDGIDVSAYFDKHKAILSGETVELLLAGRFAPGKGQIDAIQAVELLKEKGVKAHLVLVGGVGDPAYRQRCEDYVRMHKLEEWVEILEFTEDISSLRARADISLTCSTSEAMGRVTAEGMMAGCLAVAADAGATSEILVHGETGYLYEVGCPEALAHCVESALEQREESRRIASEGQLWSCSHFDVKAYGSQIIDLYLDCLSEDGWPVV